MTTTEAKPARQKSPALPPVNSRCQEADFRVKDHYVPCKQIATRVVTWMPERNETYTMCLACSDRSVKNRGARLVRQGEAYELTPIGIMTKEEERARASNSRDASEKLALESIQLEEAPKEVGDDEVRSVAEQANAAARLEDEIADLLAQAEAKRKELESALNQALPAAMKLIGAKSLPLLSGNQVLLEDLVGGYIKAANRDEAYRHLEKTGSGSLIKRTYVIEFEKDEKWSEKFERDLEKRKRKLVWKKTEAVNVGSLGAEIRERLAKNLPMRRDLLGVYELTRAKIVRPGGASKKPPSKDRRSKAERMAELGQAEEM